MCRDIAGNRQFCAHLASIFADFAASAECGAAFLTGWCSVGAGGQGRIPSKNRRLGRRLAVATVLAGKPCDMLDNAASVLGSAEDQQKPAEAHIKDLHAKIGPLTLGVVMAITPDQTTIVIF